MWKRKTLQYGIPFMIFILGGSVGLREFTILRYEYTQTNEYKAQEDLIKDEIEMKPSRETTIEKEYEKLQKLDLDNWENKRISRPWVE